jgi:hypothetical protein
VPEPSSDLNTGRRESCQARKPPLKAVFLTAHVCAKFASAACLQKAVFAALQTSIWHAAALTTQECHSTTGFDFEHTRQAGLLALTVVAL